MRGRKIFTGFGEGFEINVAGKARTGTEEFGRRGENSGTGSDIQEAISLVKMLFQGFERKLSRRLIAGA
jgi:hypothetical protein